MAASDQTWPWLYEPRNTDPAEVKDAHLELLKDEVDLADIDFSTEEYSIKTSGCISYVAENIVSESSGDDDELNVAFSSHSVQLPASASVLHSVERVVKADDIRYVAMVNKNSAKILCDDWLVMLSIWIPVDRLILNIYLRLPSAKEALLVVNSISKLIVEASEVSAVRLQKFRLVHSGSVSVSSCTVDERDEREKTVIENMKNLKVDGSANNGTNGILEGDSIEKKEKVEGVGEGGSEELEPLKQQKMSFVLDEETLSLYEHPLSPKAVHEFRFYKEPEPNAIDMIYICNSTGQLEIQQQQQVYFMSAITGETEENFKELSSILRAGTMKPKPKDIFSDLKKFAEFFGEPKAQKPKTSTTEYSEMKPDLQLPFQSPVPPAAQASQARSKTEADPWLKHLLTGEHLANTDEELQMNWFTIEHELSSCIAGSVIPDSEFESAGLDPENTNQLLTAVEDVKDKLLSKDFDLAVSRARGLLKVFGGTILKSVNPMEEVELLKRIFFLSG